MKEQSQSTSSSPLLNTDGGKTKSNAIEIPSISLPKGGGAIKGIDEKFSVNPSNGTSTISIPLPFSPNRNGFTPELALSYNSGAGNSLFGIGWDLGLPSIQRRTDKKLPRYFDNNDEEQIEIEDSFMFSGMEELVPYMDYLPNNSWKLRQIETGDYLIRQYRPRIESGFARIERIYKKSTSTYYWKVTSNGNMTTFFGLNDVCRIANPDDNTKVFQWLPELSYDDKGSWVWYQYKSEDLVGVLNSLHEKNRFQNNAKISNKHISKIKYGNEVASYFETNPYEPSLPINENYFFELAFDYGEYDFTNADNLIENNPWSDRSDAYSIYKIGFELRTSRLCRKVLMFHKFPELNNGKKTLVRSVDFGYKFSNLHADNSNKSQSNCEVTYLESITQCGYVKDGPTYSKKALPTMKFTYQELNWNKNIIVQNVSADNLIHAPIGLSGNYQWVDLYNEGINGILTEQANGWYYKSNLGRVQPDTDVLGDLTFTQIVEVAPKPSFLGLSNGQLQLADLDANGEKQLVINSPGLQGYFELDDEGIWLPFKAFVKTLNLDLSQPNVRMMDVNGDGIPDVVLCDEGAFWFWENQGKLGYDSPEVAANPYDEELGPSLVFTDAIQRIFLADMTGDGMSDIVHILNGSVSYWPNLGYGKFGAKVSMSNAPLFDHKDLYNPEYLQLTDISGTGASDIIYLGQNSFKAYLNCSGNVWSDVEEISPSFPMEYPNRITITDLLGQGTACIVWSSELPAYAGNPMRYIDLMGGTKPHIMLSQDNGMGKVNTIEYKSSTFFYLKDKLNGTPWITKLPFPVQVVAKSTLSEKVTGVRFTSAYTYHHGYYDHLEKEFRGFGRVEQIDTETFDVFEISNASNIVPLEHHQPPVLTKTWFHTGVYIDKERILSHYKKEYWQEIYRNKGYTTNSMEYELPDAIILPSKNLNAFDINGLMPEEWREALRACKGMMLRQEVFGLDAEKRTSDEKIAKSYSTNDPAFVAFQIEAKRTELLPYSVATHNCEIQIMQQQGVNRYGVFMVKESEAISYAYERNPADPRIAHSLTIDTDELGNVLEAASIVYPRLQEEELLKEDSSDSKEIKAAKKYGRDAQKKQWISFIQNDVTNDVISTQEYYLRKSYQTKTWELTGLSHSNGFLYKIADFKNRINSISVIAYQDAPTNGKVQKRLIEHIKTKFYDGDLSSALPDGVQAGRGIPFEAYQLAYTPDLISYIFKPTANSVPFTVTDQDMVKGKFLKDDGNWWIQSGTVHFRRIGEMDLVKVKERFFTPVAYTDAYDSKTEVFYDSLQLYMEHSKDELDNENKIIRFNYRTLSPDIMCDLNDNLSSVVVDELGMVKAASIEGKGSEADNLTGIEEATRPADITLISAFFTSANVVAPTICDSDNLHRIARSLLKNSSVRMVYDFTSQPTVVASIVREQHAVANALSSPLQISFEYSDGLGKVAMKKIQAESGLVKLPGGADLDTGAKLRWIGNGRTVLNNKGNPIRQYEPYFSTTPAYESDPAWVERGVSPVLYYDGAGRNVKTEMPDGTFTKVVFDAWKQLQYDPNDTILDSKWYQSRISLITGNPDRLAAERSKIHNDTPECIITDTLGRPFLSIEHNGWVQKAGGLRDEKYYTFSHRDIEGNSLSLTDARGNEVMEWYYDMLGHQVAQKSMDAGRRWMLNNAIGNPLKSWDERQHVYAYTYDKLHRPLATILTKASTQYTIGKIRYGEGSVNDKDANVRGKVIEVYDASGRIRTPSYDFKGNPIEVKRQLTSAYDAEIIDWEVANPDALLMTEVFTQSTTYDALGRMTMLNNFNRKKDTSIYIPQYNDRGVLHSETISVRTIVTQAIRKIEYNEKGQRTCIQYGGKVKPDGSSDLLTTTRYHYNTETFRLKQLRTTRHNYEPTFPHYRSNLLDNNVLQQRIYTYDAVGNIMEIEDQAYEPVFFNNQMVEPKSTYTYDALYRLIEATGRENNAATQAPRGFGTVETMPPMNSFGLRNYTQRYEYDSVGNFLKMVHTLPNPAYAASQWTRIYQTATDSNRLLKTNSDKPIEEVNYQYDAHGNMLNFSGSNAQHIWDYRDMVQHLDLGGGGDAWYQYDSSKQRSRKVIRRSSSEYWERIYLGGYELYRRYVNEKIVEETETHHLFADDQRILIVEDVIQSSSTSNIASGVLLRYQYGNHLGSATLELNDAADIISYEEYHPYGTTAYQAKNGNINCAAKRYRYTGMERDEESGLAYHAARYYLPWLGRWGSGDPIGIEGGGNVYAYVNDSPVINKDTKGLFNELVHGVATYLLAIYAGFKPEDAAKIALGSASMDYNPDTVPVDLENVFSGTTKDIHFPSYEEAGKRLWKQVAPSEGMRIDLIKFGKAFHSSQDVGFSNELPGPHNRGFGGRNTRFGIGHGGDVSEIGVVAIPINSHVVDEVHQYPTINREFLKEQYGLLSYLARQYYKDDPELELRRSRSHAYAVIEEIVKADTIEKAMKLREFEPPKIIYGPTNKNNIETYSSYGHWVSQNYLGYLPWGYKLGAIWASFDYSSTTQPSVKKNTRICVLVSPVEAVNLSCHGNKGQQLDLTPPPTYAMPMTTAQQRHR